MSAFKPRFALGISLPKLKTKGGGGEGGAGSLLGGSLDDIKKKGAEAVGGALKGLFK